MMLTYRYKKKGRSKTTFSNAVVLTYCAIALQVFVVMSSTKLLLVTAQNETQQPTVIATTTQPEEQQQQQQEVCNICTISGSTLKSTELPLHLSKSGMPSFLSNDELAIITNKNNTNDMTCSEWQEYVNDDHTISLSSSSSNNIDNVANRRCLSYQNWLQYACCDGITTPLYECQKVVIDKLLISPIDGIPYNKDVSPISGGDVLDVYTSLHVNDYSISNYGVNGGSVEVVGTIIHHWTDSQLQWNPNDVGGCTEIQLKASHDPTQSDIWVPFRSSSVKPGEASSSSKATVLSDGSVTWTRTLKLDMVCKEIFPFMSKACTYSVGAEEGALWDGDNIKYIVGSPIDNVAEEDISGGISFDDLFILPAYAVNKNQTYMNIVSDDVTGNTEIITQMVLEPIETTCFLCAGIAGTTIRNDTIPLAFNDGALWPEANNKTCRQIEDLFLSMTYIGDPWGMCYYRVLYSQECCSGLPPQRDCEDNVRSNILEQFEDGTVVPPNPRPDSQGSMIDVEVSLDVTHILDIDIKSNSLEVLVSLELLWLDQSMVWDPFIGECTAVSFRASLDPEATEIWVPELDLMNQIEGTSGFANSFATVFSDGNVWWRRTGVLNVACDLKGVKYFPFDHPSCSLDFGAPRSPLAHRVNYTLGDVEFSDRLRDKTGLYQEYHLDTNRTVISAESESMSMYTNNYIRFSFVFDRAVPYYMWAFVVLYILFTYLSFGMFYLDTQVGERLGFGTGILFVIVAQDITVAEYTPIAQKQLWINQVSLVSKVFVIVAIVQSIFILYYYFVNDLNGDGVDNELDRVDLVDENETESLMKKTTGNGNDVDPELVESLAVENEEEESIYDSEGGKVQPNGLSTNTGTTSSAKGKKEGESSFPLSPRSKKMANEVGPTSRRMIKLFLGVDIGPDASIQTQKVMKLRLFDRLTAYVFLFGYTVFLIVMFVIGRVRSGKD